MSETQTENAEIEVTGPAPKKLTLNDFAKQIQKTPLEIWTKLLQTRHDRTAKTKDEWLKLINDIGKETV